MSSHETYRFNIAKVKRQYQNLLWKNSINSLNYTVKQTKELVGRTSPLPSSPGEPPRKVSGKLQRSIKGKLEQQSDGIQLFLFSDSPYALRLEFGYVGTDSKGRRIHQAPRPFLRRVLRDHQREIFGFLAKP